LPGGIKYGKIKRKTVAVSDRKVTEIHSVELTGEVIVWEENMENKKG
jgi:hypothetical protein